MPAIDGKEYPRLENGQVLYGPPAKAKAEPDEAARPPQGQRKKKATRKRDA